MFPNQRSALNERIVDDYPVRPTAITQDHQIVSSGLKRHKRTIIVFSLLYFLYGSGLSIYNLLYLKLARKSGIPLWIYGSVLASSHLMSVLFYPLSCHIASHISIRNYLSVSIFVMGSCRILLGSTFLILEKKSFIILSYAIELMEGIGISLFIVSTVVTAGSLAKDIMWKFSFAIQVSLCLGLVLGPPCVQVLYEELGFDVVCYIAGGLTALSSILTATILKEPEQRITYTDMPIVSWMSNKRMLVYFFIMLETFIYIGFLCASLNIILKKFNLSNLYIATIFSLTPFVYALSISGWKWLIKKGFNNVMLVFIGSVATVASLILLGPAPFTSLKASLMYACLALVLEGLGLSCKCVCVLDAAKKDLSYEKKHTEIQQKLIVPTAVMLGASFGYFCGILTAGIMNSYLGYKKATLPHFVLEIITAIGVLIFALNRNYVSKSRREVGESQPILQP